MSSHNPTIAASTEDEPSHKQNGSVTAENNNSSIHTILDPTSLVSIILVLPDGQLIENFQCRASTSFGEVLKQICVQCQLAPSDYVLIVDNEEEEAVTYVEGMECRPNNLVGLTKKRRFLVYPRDQLVKNPYSYKAMREKKQSVTKVEMTNRVLVHLPQQKRVVVRISLKESVKSVFDQVCSEKQLYPPDFVVCHPDTREPLDMQRSLADYNIMELLIEKISGPCESQTLPKRSGAKAMLPSRLKAKSASKATGINQFGDDVRHERGASYHGSSISLAAAGTHGDGRSKKQSKINAFLTFLRIKKKKKKKPQDSVDYSASQDNIVATPPIPSRERPKFLDGARPVSAFIPPSHDDAARPTGRQKKRRAPQPPGRTTGDDRLGAQAVGLSQSVPALPSLVAVELELHEEPTEEGKEEVEVRPEVKEEEEELRAIAEAERKHHSSHDTGFHSSGSNEVDLSVEKTSSHNHRKRKVPAPRPPTPPSAEDPPRAPPHFVAPPPPAEPPPPDVPITLKPYHEDKAVSTPTLDESPEEESLGEMLDSMEGAESLGVEEKNEEEVEEISVLAADKFDEEDEKEIKVVEVVVDKSDGLEDKIEMLINKEERKDEDVELIVDELEENEEKERDVRKEIEDLELVADESDGLERVEVSDKEEVEELIEDKLDEDEEEENRNKEDVALEADNLNCCVDMIEESSEHEEEKRKEIEDVELVADESDGLERVEVSRKEEDVELIADDLKANAEDISAIDGSAEDKEEEIKEIEPIEIEKQEDEQIIVQAEIAVEDPQIVTPQVNHDHEEDDESFSIDLAKEDEELEVAFASAQDEAAVATEEETTDSELAAIHEQGHLESSSPSADRDTGINDPVAEMVENSRTELLNDLHHFHIQEAATELVDSVLAAAVLQVESGSTEEVNEGGVIDEVEVESQQKTFVVQETEKESPDLPQEDVALVDQHKTYVVQETEKVFSDLPQEDVAFVDQQDKPEEIVIFSPTSTEDNLQLLKEDPRHLAARTRCSELAFDPQAESEEEAQLEVKLVSSAPKSFSPEHDFETVSITSGGEIFVKSRVEREPEPEVEYQEEEHEVELEPQPEVDYQDEEGVESVTEAEGDCREEAEEVEIELKARTERNLHLEPDFKAEMELEVEHEPEPEVKYQEEQQLEVELQPKLKRNILLQPDPQPEMEVESQSTFDADFNEDAQLELDSDSTSEPTPQLEPELTPTASVDGHDDDLDAQNNLVPASLNLSTATLDQSEVNTDNDLPLSDSSSIARRSVSPWSGASGGEGKSIFLRAVEQRASDPAIADLEQQLDSWRDQLVINRKRLEATSPDSSVNGGAGSESLMQQQIQLQQALMDQMEKNITTLKAKRSSSTEPSSTPSNGGLTSSISLSSFERATTPAHVAPRIVRQCDQHRDAAKPIFDSRVHLPSGPASDLSSAVSPPNSVTGQTSARAARMAARAERRSESARSDDV